MPDTNFNDPSRLNAAPQAERRRIQARSNVERRANWVAKPAGVLPQRRWNEAYVEARPSLDFDDSPGTA